MLTIVFTSGLSLLLLALVTRDTWRLTLIPALRAAEAVPHAPFVSLLIPARNEAMRIERCLDGALAQTYPAYEVIVVDDGSTDATPQILSSYAAQDYRLRVIHGEALPAGWIGKCYACQQAANQAQGAWLLFLDADTAPQPGLVTALIDHAERHELDMLTLFPFMEFGSFWERVIMPPFLALINAVFPPERQNAPDVRPEEIVANGQCILVRANAYRAIGGHAAVHGEVLEDVQLAQALRKSGARTGVASGQPFLRVRMYTNGAEVVEGLAKNAIAGARSGGGRALWGGLRQFLLAFGAQWLLLDSLWLFVMQQQFLAWIVLLHGIIVLIVVLSFWALLLRRLYRQPVAYALLWPLGMLCYGCIALWALWRIWSRRGVTWKGRAYAG